MRISHLMLLFAFITSDASFICLLLCFEPVLRTSGYLRFYYVPDDELVMRPHIL